MTAYYDERFGSPAHLPPVPDSKDMVTLIFAGMIKEGLLRENDPSMLAFVYTVPISALIHLCGREPEKAEDAMTRAEAFSRYSIKIHGVQ